jgi:hypothetical protein
MNTYVSHRKHWILAIIINPAAMIVPQDKPVYVPARSSYLTLRITTLSMIAVFDSIASKKTAEDIHLQLSAWLHHKAQNPTEGSVNIVKIIAQVISP